MILKNNQETFDPRLDRVPQFDERSRNYPVREILKAYPPRSYTWRNNYYLNQGREGACVGFAWAHELGNRPVEYSVTNELGQSIYKRAQLLDAWPGEDYSGTSIIAGAKATQEMGRIKEYRWAFGLDDLILGLGYKGPAVLGLNWYMGMMNTDSNGFIRASGVIMGGHAIVARGVNLKNKYVLLRNSWGSKWGVNGDCKISFDDLGRLLSEDGEAVIGIKDIK